MRTAGRWSFRVIIALLLFTAAAQVKYRYLGVRGNDWHEAVNSDGRGYYEYLHMFFFRATPDPRPVQGIVHPSIDAPVIKHFSGAAVCMAPFFLSAHLYTLLRPDRPEDGFSLHYQIAVGLAALCWLAVGLFALRRFLLEIGMTDTAAAITLALLTLGTGLIVQAVVHPAMSHVYGFAVIALLFSRARQLLLHPSQQDLVLCALLLALAGLIRPVNLLAAIALPLAALNGTTDRAGLRALLRSRAVALASLAFAVFISLQSLLWYLQCGSFVVDSYPDEGFLWDRPEVLNSLFSARNGLFFYWPILALVIPGAWSLFRKDRRATWTLIGFLLMFVYITSCWWNWAYGDNFGQRPYIDILPVLAIPFAHAIPKRIFLRAALLCGGTLLCTLNLFQGWQYWGNLLITGQMDPIRYRYLFLEREPQKALRVGGFAELRLYAPRGYAELPVQWHVSELVHMTILDATRHDLISAHVPDSTIGKPLYLEVDLERTLVDPETAHDAWVRLMLRRNGQARGALGSRMDLVPNAGANEQHWHYAFNVKQHERGDTLVLEVGNGIGLRVDDIHASLSMRR